MEVYRSSFFQNFTPVPDDIFDPRCSLSSTEKLVYIIYLKHTDRNSGVAWPGNKRVAEMAQVSVSSLKRISAVLESKSYISKEARFNEKGQQLTNLIMVRHPLETADFRGGTKNDTLKKAGGGITHNTPGGTTHDTQTRTIRNQIEEEERAKITAEEKVNFQRQNSCQQNKSSTEDPIEKAVEEKVNSDQPGIGLEFAEDLSCSNSAVSIQSVYEEPPSLYKGEMRPSLGDCSENVVEMVMKKLNINCALAFLVAARCRDKGLLEKVIDQLINAKKPIRNMTAYLLTLMSRPDQWELFIENVENEFLTRERPKKKNKREVKPKYLEEDREIYIPPSARNG